jgi:hypothetical protein
MPSFNLMAATTKRQMKSQMRFKLFNLPFRNFLPVLGTAGFKPLKLELLARHSAIYTTAYGWCTLNLP